TLAFVDIRTREVNLALFLTNDSGAAHVYVVSPMSEAVCRAHSEEISSRLRGGQRSAHLVWRSCTDAGRDSVLPDGCHLNAAAVTVADVPSARLRPYECGSSRVARTASHKRTTSGSNPVLTSTATPDTDPQTQPTGDDVPVTASAVETSVTAPAPQATAP